jgi:hypothetical protein
MTFGLNVFNALGGLSYSSNDVTWNQVDFFEVVGDGSASYSYPVLAGKEVLTAQMFVNSPPTDKKAKAHTVTVSGTTVFASGGSEASYILVMMR